jgi:hypothetical protein
MVILSQKVRFSFLLVKLGNFASRKNSLDPENPSTGGGRLAVKETPKV